MRSQSTDSSWAPILHWFPTKGSRADQKWPSRPDKKFQFNLSMDLWAFLASYLSDTMEMELGKKLVCNFPFLVKLFRYISKLKKMEIFFFNLRPATPYLCGARRPHWVDSWKNHQDGKNFVFVRNHLPSQFPLIFKTRSSPQTNVCLICFLVSFTTSPLAAGSEAGNLVAPRK